ncbi:UDP-3-O-(3-hydroxymyristoyl)glucosamine N-acyltransferase [Aureispira anguillae]|uniref:UDP-3-O-(3-hydroxymyristoyl)glucosamine N-acyltransferase n=1 Tax=Aureispira anguillae TaxID=2864201 RepID=A0A915YLJ1_9BACT|nr:UDP-3-O-(3-hydroxymyristoyl)glucosamine N-acyltransferase [Aureispira anguillae]BDS14973.1 UDP-3-O-(3-hydroxymyristoyl)glucosamine N-acyltransferase [Aureispira anguillae]
MKFKMPISISDIGELIGAKIIGNSDIKVTYLSEIHKVEEGSLMFVDNEKYYSQAIYSTATAIIIDKEVDCPEGKALLIVDKPFEAYNQLALHFNPFVAIQSNISPTAIIGENTILEPGVVVGNHVTIGDNCLIRANTVLLDNTKIGNHVIIHANSSIGNDAFYMNKKADQSYQRWHSIGRVIIEDNVEIGASCTIDKGVSGDTVIGEGTKIDNLVHVGHGVRIGKHCLLAAQVGIAGKTIIQDYVTIYGQVGISKSLVVGEGATILAKAGVPKSIPGGDKEYVGIPAGESRAKFREMAALRQLPEIVKKVNEIYTALFKNKKKDS